jgi:hypothetical protein
VVQGLGGGGGGGDYGYTAGSGGSGIVIARYSGLTQLAYGGTITTSGGNTIHTFTSSGIFYTGTGTAKATGGDISLGLQPIGYTHLHHQEHSLLINP